MPHRPVYLWKLLRISLDRGDDCIRGAEELRTQATAPPFVPLCGGEDLLQRDWANNAESRSKPVLQTLACLGPRNCRGWIRSVFCQTPGQLGSLLLGDRQRGGISRDTVPELLGEMDAFRVAQTQQIGSSSGHGTRLARHGRSRSGPAPAA